MTLRLTTQESFIRLLDYLERERDLVWPDWKGIDKTYRDYFVEIVTEKMATDTVFLNVDWGYNAQTNRVESKAYYSLGSETKTDEEYLEEQSKIETE